LNYIEATVKLKDRESSISRNIKINPQIDDKNNISVEDIKNIDFPKSSSPLVSIIIPVFNSWQYTYRCLSSIFDHTGEVDYEIIIADDCSNDKTALLMQKITGINYLKNEHNLGFLLNCNSAADHAAGKYLVFLNNDTLVRPGWLSALVNSVETDQKIGISGSKIIDQSGMLSECGWVMYDNGWGIPVGRWQDPSLAEFSSRRDVDFIGGACFLVKKEYFIKAGKFDERFVPGYFEEVDLCYTARKMGYKVIIEPSSEVVHFGSISYGKSGKDVMVKRNHGIFYAKWKSVLAKT